MSAVTPVGLVSHRVSFDMIKQHGSARFLILTLPSRARLQSLRGGIAMLLDTSGSQDYYFEAFEMTTRLAVDGMFMKPYMSRASPYMNKPRTSP